MYVTVHGGTGAGRKAPLKPRFTTDWQCPDCDARNKHYWLKCPNCGHRRPEVDR